jgi:hydrophobe/amphiphile efflux-1 (HAE1) family protein
MPKNPSPLNLIALSIRRPVFAWVLMSALIIFGAIFANRLGVSQLPDVDFPVLTVSVNYEGAAPEVVEAEIIDPIEQGLLAIEGVKQMRSTVRQGGGSVTLEFDIERNVDVALQEVQTALSQVRLPTGVDNPVVRKQNPEENPIMFLSVAAPKPIREVISYTEDVILDELRFLPGVGEVSIGGFAVRNLRVWPNPEKMRRFDLTLIDVLDAVQSQHIETAAGQLNNGQSESRVRWLGEAASPEELANVRILRRGGGIIHDAVIRIGDVAEVEDGLSDIRRMARVDGKEALSLLVRKQRGQNEVRVAKAVTDRVKALQDRLPEGYIFRINVDFTRSTEATVNSTYSKLWVAGLVTILVCFIFLGSWQAALNILFSIPTSIVGTFTIIYWSGFTLNLFTLLALTLAISIVVDDAIMLLENIVRHHRMGKSAAQASYDGSMEVLGAAIAASLAVVAVFIPVVFMGGVVGKFFYQFGITMSAAVLLSLLEAVTITPMRAAAFLSTSPKPNRFEVWLDHAFERWSDFYKRLLHGALSRPWWVTGVATLLFAVSLISFQKINKELVPSQDLNLIFISGQAPPGTSLEKTYEAAVSAEEVVKAEPLIERYFVTVGAGGPNAEVNQFSIPTFLKDKTQRSETHVEIMERLRNKFKEVKGVRITMRDLSSRGLTGGRSYPVAFNISGGNLETLQTAAKKIQEELEKEGLATDLDTDFKLGIPELLIKPDREKMAQFGVSIDAVARTLTTAIAGLRVNRFTNEGRRYDVRIKVRDQIVRTLDDIRKITVRNQFGNQVPLANLVSFETSKSYQSITRVNRMRTIGVFGNVGEGKSQQAALARAQALAKEHLPENYRVGLDGAAAGLAEGFQSLLTALIMGFVVAYMVLAIQYNSFLHPISVLMALPFGLTGAVLSLWAFGQSLNLFSFIGIIVLMGIAKKNSILLVDFTNQVRARGERDVRKALIEACPVRLRPILMTSVATIAAAMPLVLGNDIGQETRTPMGLTIIGGSFVSTIFTLFVVPCIYLLLAKLESKKPRAELVL